MGRRLWDRQTGSELAGEAGKKNPLGRRNWTQVVFRDRRVRSACDWQGLAGAGGRTLAHSQTEEGIKEAREVVPEGPPE